jgi:hypothetical protein
MDDINYLALGERRNFGESLEQLTALDELGYHIVVLCVFN